MRKPEDVTAKERYIGILRFLYYIGDYKFQNDWGLGWSPDCTIDGVNYQLNECTLEIRDGNKYRSYYLDEPDKIPDDLPYDLLLKDVMHDVEVEIPSMRAEVDMMERILLAMSEGRTTWHTLSKCGPVEEEADDRGE